MVFGWVDLNGDILEAGQAYVSVFDHGFTRGDSVFETMRVYDRVPFMWDAHAERLARSAYYLGFPRLGVLDLKQRAERLIDRSALSDAVLRVQISSGLSDLLAPIDTEINLTSVLTLTPLPQTLPLTSRGVSSMVSTVRRVHRLALDPRAKTGNYLNSLLAAREARRLGYDEAILLDAERRVTETAFGNVFAWIEDCWFTPTLQTGILDGITREVLLDVCLAHQIPVVEHTLGVEDLELADEIFLCSSVREIVPVVSFRDLPVGNGRVGVETHRLYRCFLKTVSAYVEAATARG